MGQECLLTGNGREETLCDARMFSILEYYTCVTR